MRVARLSSRASPTVPFHLRTGGTDNRLALVRVGQALGLVLDVRGQRCQCGEVLACVVSAEQKFPTFGQRDSDVRLRAAPVAAVAGR